jgi:hypothetical protein
LLIPLLIAAAGPSAAINPQPGAIAAPTAIVAPKLAPLATETSLILPAGTMVRLMVLNEVNSRDHKAGDRFVLRVDEDVVINGVKVISIGAKGWGEVLSSQATSGLGKSGRLNARLLYVEAGDQRVPVTGERETAGTGGTGQVVGAVVGFGLFGLLMKGNNATLKAGEILNGYTSQEITFDPRTAPKPL